MDDQSLRVDYTASELRYNAFLLPAYRSALATLHLSDGARVLDAGCGPGGLFAVLSEAVGPRGHITGVDGSPLHLEAAREAAAHHDVRAPVTLVQADLRRSLEFADDTFDCAWCADVLWPILFSDPVAVVRELARVVKPGGTVGVFFGNFYRALHLPGYRRLETLVLSALSLDMQTEEQITSAWSVPSSYERAMRWLQAAGLHECTLSMHPLLYQQPLPPQVLDYLQSYVFAEAYGPALERRGAEVGMSDADCALARDLIRPDAPHSILDQPDYYCQQTTILATGRV